MAVTTVSTGSALGAPAISPPPASQIVRLDAGIPARPCALNLTPELSNFDQTPARKRGTFRSMASEIHIVEVEKDGEDGLLVTFSDGTVGGYVVEELLELRPIREKVKETPPAQRLAIGLPLSVPVPLIAVH